MTTLQRPSPAEPPLDVAISAISLIRPLTGIGQYTLNLAHALMRHSDLRLHCFYGKPWSDQPEPRAVPHLAFTKRVAKRLVPQPYEVSRAIQQMFFNRGVRARRPRVYHEPNYLPYKYDGPIVLTIHDLSYLRYPETHPELRVRIMNKLLPPAIEKAAHLFADSEFTRQEVLREFGVAPERVTTTLLGVSPLFRPRDERDCAAVLAELGLRHRGYTLAVGTLEPRKNLLQVIRAYADLPPALAVACPLVIVGGQGWKSVETERALAALLANGRARRLGYLPEEQLPAIYSAARLFVFPSLYEGFGLPAAEAMASGVPVMVSDRASLPEVVGTAGVCVDPSDVEAMREAIERLLEDDDERARRIEAGIARAATLTWERCADITANVYRQVAARA